MDRHDGKLRSFNKKKALYPNRDLYPGPSDKNSDALPTELTELSFKESL